MKEFLILLKTIPRLNHDDQWTPADNAIVSEHFQHLESLKAEGKLFMAGRNLVEGADRLGLVVIYAEDQEEAKRLMEKDPAIAKGIMTGKVYPYRIALK